jgi:hypothetical protein
MKTWLLFNQNRIKERWISKIFLASVMHTRGFDERNPKVDFVGHLVNAQ